MEEMSITEAAKALGVSTDTVRRRIKSGEIKATMRTGAWGKQYFIPRGEIKSESKEKPAQPSFSDKALIDIVETQHMLIGIMKLSIDTLNEQKEMIKSSENQVAKLSKQIAELDQSFQESLKSSRKLWGK